MKALIKDNLVYCKMCEAHNYKILDYKTVEIKGKSHTKFIARCICETEFYFFSKNEKHYVIDEDEEVAEIEENLEVNKEMVTITKEEYESLLDSEDRLSALENNGVEMVMQ